MAVAAPFFREFDLPARGVELRRSDAAYAPPLLDGPAAVAYRDLARTCERLGRDGPRWLVEPLTAHGEDFVRLILRADRAGPHHAIAPPPHRRQLAAPTVWLPHPDEPHVTPPDGRVLPQWATTKIRTGIIPRPDKQPSLLLSVRVDDAGSGMDARAHTRLYGAEDARTAYAVAGVPLLLAELHPNALTKTHHGTPAPLSQPPYSARDAWPGFFHRAHRLLPPEGLLLIATRQWRDEGQLTDPLGEFIAAARTAGFTYLHA